MNPALDTVVKSFRKLLPALDFWSLRLVAEHRESISVRQGVLQPLNNSYQRGAFLTVGENGGMGYAATSDLSSNGLMQALAQARKWAAQTKECNLIGVKELSKLSAQGVYQTPVIEPWSSLSLSDKISLLQNANTALKIDSRIVDWLAALQYRYTQTLLVSGDGGRIEQEFHYIAPGLLAVANEGTQTQRRTGGGADAPRQGGLEHLRSVNFPEEARVISEQALALLSAPECPRGKMDVLLMPAQMMLQIHESIGHPLELDRILGDERNYAGTSFVSLDMFGSYQYGSDLLNVTFDPSYREELATYAYDDDGTPAEKKYLIRNGILERPLGGACSQVRAGMPGVANSRACSWNRPPIDRMANLNVEPGTNSLEELIASIEYGVLMDTNRSWSIDDSRNKFQFGCEWARLIINGELKEIIRNPNYRGISATFWRNLIRVGDRSTFQVLGTPNCGKGEPNQVIHVGHASPACVFKDIDVFGGAG